MVLRNAPKWYFVAIDKAWQYIWDGLKIEEGGLGPKINLQLRKHRC